MFRNHRAVGYKGPYKRGIFLRDVIFNAPVHNRSQLKGLASSSRVAYHQRLDITSMSRLSWRTRHQSTINH